MGRGIKRGHIFSNEATLRHALQYSNRHQPCKARKVFTSYGFASSFSPTEALSKLKAGATIYVMNSNYLEEIKKISRNTYNYICIDHE